MRDPGLFISVVSTKISIIINFWYELPRILVKLNSSISSNNFVLLSSLWSRSVLGRVVMKWENLVIFGIYNNTTTPDHTIKSRNSNDQSNLSFL